MVRYGMVIDLDRCIACQACTIACNLENNTSVELDDNKVRIGVSWHRVLAIEKGEYPNHSVEYIPRPCQHCENAPCVQICPTGARRKREDGLVLIAYDTCIGCRYCLVACPYSVNIFNAANLKNEEYRNPDATGNNAGSPTYQGIVEKCTFCVHRIDKAVKEGKKMGNPDGEITTACNQACPAGARFFGDLDDPNSTVNKLIAKRSSMRLKEHLGTNPQVYYLK